MTVGVADETQRAAKTPASRLLLPLPLSQAAVGSAAEIVLTGRRKVMKMLLDQSLASDVAGLNAS